MSNITIEKNVAGLKRLFSLKENLKKCSSFERAKRYKIYSRKRLLWYYRLQLSFVYKTVSQIYSNLLCSGDKSLLSEFFRKWGWFHGHNERLPKYLCQKLKLQKLRHAFVDERAMILMTPISSCHWKTLLPFCLRKKRLEDAFLTLTVNHLLCTEKQIVLFKTTINWLFNDIWCYLVIGSFDWIIGVFKQTVVRIYP